jgi:hypothetical protein
MARPLRCPDNLFAARGLDRSPTAANEVHDQRDHREDQQQMDQEASHMEKSETAEPEDHEHYSQNKEHGIFFLGASVVAH